MKNENNETFDDFEDEGCPLAEMAISLGMLDKPFGMMWPEDKMERFLKNRGYMIIERFSDMTGGTYDVAVKADSTYIPEDERSNVREVFISEVQDIILGWLEKQ